MPRLLPPTAVLLVLAATASGLPVHMFTDTKTYAARATDIVVAECLDPDAAPGPKLDGITEVRVDVARVLKGERTPGKASLVTMGQPMEKGRRYLMASFGGSVGDITFLANAELGVVEVPATFDLKVLDGKTVAEQVQLVFDARREQVRVRLIQLEQEKTVLDRTVPRPPAPGR